MISFLKITLNLIYFFNYFLIIIFQKKKKKGLNYKSFMVIVFEILNPSYSEVMMYSPAIKLMFNLAIPWESDARLYNTPLMLKVTVTSFAGFP